MTEGKEFPPTTQTDWLVCHLRWLVLAIALIMTLLNASQPTELSLFYTVWAAIAIYNLIVLFLLAFNWFPAFLSLITLAFDTVGILALIFTSGGGDSALLLLGLFPVVVAALQHDLNISLALAAIITLSYTFFFVLEPIDLTRTDKLLATVTDVVILFLVAVVTGLVGSWEKRGVADAQAQELEELRLERDQAKVFYRMATTLSETLSYQRVLDAMLDVSFMGLEDPGHTKGRSVGIVFLFDKKGSLRVAASRHLYRDDRGEKIRGEAGLVAQAIALAEPAISDDVVHDPELGRFASLFHCRSAVAVPLRAGFENYGAVLFASPRSKAYSEDHKELLSIFADQATVALQNAQLYQSLHEEKERIINADEEARRKLASNLHDGPTQSIAAIAMRLSFTKLLLARDPDKVKEELEKLEELARRTTQEIRTMLFTMRPVVLETQGLAPALEQYIGRLAEVEEFRPHLQVQVEPDDLAGCLDVEMAGVIFSIIEEGVNNARKHAEADNVWVRLNIQNGLLVTEIEDDGQGFDVTVEETYHQRGSLGLINLRERAALIDGRVEIRSVIGQGTVITLVVPLDRESVS